MEKSIKKYWPIFVLPTFAAFIIGFIVPFIEGIYHFANLLQSEMPPSWAYLIM